MTRITLRLVTLLGVAATACAPAVVTQSGGGVAPSGPGAVLGSTPRLSLQSAMHQGRDLGTVPASTPLHLEASLALRNAAEFDALVARGVQVSHDQYVQRFGPDPTAVGVARDLLAARGIALRWSSGDQLATLDGDAGAVSRVFSVRLHEFVAPTGEHFHAPLSAAVIPPALRDTVTALTGLEDWTQHHVSAIRGLHGVSPGDMAAFYDMEGVRSSGIDGSGMTVVFPEIDSFSQADLDAYAAKYNLPPFAVEVHRNKLWGDPGGIDGEANMDIELVHAFAPAAKLVVYYSSAKNVQVLPMLQAMFSEQAGPTTIVSSSIGTCETLGEKGEALQEETMAHAAAGKGTSIFIASGDRGAYDCLPSGDSDTLAVDLDASLPDVTSVGGTTVFLGENAGYSKETAWGEPVEQWGGGGGLSIFWKLPSWQVAPGVQNGFSNGHRQVPDVSANADAQSGWNVISDGAEHKIGGTSAAAPMWAGITALFDQILVQQHHQTIGLANEGLYWMAAHASSLPAPPFHDVTQGTNLNYSATNGWDYATGLGSPDVGALAVDWPKYMESQGK